MLLKYAISKPMYEALNAPSLDVKFSTLPISSSPVLENNPKTILSFPDARFRTANLLNGDLYR